MSALWMSGVAVICGVLLGDVTLPTSKQAVTVTDREFFEVTADATGALIVNGESKTLDGFRVAFAIWREKVRPSDEHGGFCAHPLRILADQRAEAKHVQKLLQVAGHVDFKVYKIQLMTATPEDGEGSTAIRYYLPKDVGVKDSESIEQVEVHIKRNRLRAVEGFHFDVKDLGIRLGPREMAGLPQLEWSLQKILELNPKARVTLYPHAGTLVADLYAILSVTQQAGFQLAGIAGAPKES